MPELIALTFLLASAALIISLYNAYINRRRLDISVSDPTFTVDEILLIDDNAEPHTISGKGKHILHVVVVNPTTHNITFYPPEVLDGESKDSLQYFIAENFINLVSYKKVICRKGDTRTLLSIPSGNPCICPGNGIVVMDLIVDDIPSDYIVCITYAVRTLLKQFDPVTPQRYQTFHEIVPNPKEADESVST